jgi:hypothetical protein
METKEQLIKTVREWVKIDNEMRTLQRELTKRKNEKKQVSKNLIDVMRVNTIDCFDIKDGQIMYVKKTSKKPITKKNLFDILSNYYKGDAEKVNELNTFILESREDVTKETVILKMNKK